MSKNVGSIDRILRLVVGLVLAGLFFYQPDAGKNEAKDDADDTINGSDVFRHGKTPVLSGYNVLNTSEIFDVSQSLCLFAAMALFKAR